MEQIKCTIIQDILPLYVDDVVSQDTKEMVEEHLQHCDNCQKEYELMKSELSIPVETKVPLFKNISKKWRRKKMIISIGSILATTIILVGAFLYALYYETVIPYSENLFNIQTQNDGQLVLHYYGKSYATVSETHPIPLDIDGEKKNVSFIFYTKTFIDSPSRNLINDEKIDDKQGYSWKLSESEKTDAVYYVDFDVKEITAGEDSWNSILERAVLIWEK